jgi:plasmid maintenance system killer protein
VLVCKIRTFAGKRTNALYEQGKPGKIPPNIHARALRKLECVNRDACLVDLKVPRGNKLHKLRDDL